MSDSNFESESGDASGIASNLYRVMTGNNRVLQFSVGVDGGSLILRRTAKTIDRQRKKLMGVPKK